VDLVEQIVPAGAVREDGGEHVPGEQGEPPHTLHPADGALIKISQHRVRAVLASIHKLWPEFDSWRGDSGDRPAPESILPGGVRPLWFSRTNSKPRSQSFVHQIKIFKGLES